MSNRSRCKPLAVLASVLVVGVVATCLTVRKAQERRVFVSNFVAGYRCRCTLSTDWKPAHGTYGAPHGTVESSPFFASPGPFREWIATHLFHQPPATGSIVKGRPQLLLGTETGKAHPPITIQAGYPELDLHVQGMSQTKVLSEKHLRIDSCPATITDMNLVSYGITGHFTILLVCTPDYENTYFVESWATPNYSDPLDQEMQAIIASFHVEKVAPMGGKR